MSAWIFAVPADHPCLAGHFPGHPVVPAVLLLEQVALALAAQNRRVGRIVSAKFVQALLPGQAAAVELDIDADTCGFAIHHGPTLLARGQIHMATA